MTRNIIKKLVILNLCILVVDSLLYAFVPFNALFNEKNLFVSSLSLTLYVMSLIVFIVWNYSILSNKRVIKLFNNSELIETKDYLDAINKCSDLEKRVFKKEISSTVNQINRLKEKENSLNIILKQFFTEGDLTYTRFKTITLNTKNIFLSNVKKLVNRIIIFDEIEYQNLQKKYGDNIIDCSSTDDKVKIYKEHLIYINDLIKQNETILTKFDALLLEISKLDDIDKDTFEHLQAIEDINKLIETTKFYKEN